MGKKILIVEDELPLQRAVYEKFLREGHKVEAARNVDDALNVLKKQGGVDLVWLDHYLLGQGTGLDLVKTMKKQPAWASIPVVVVSNTASNERIGEYHQNGVKKCYIKSEHRLDEIFSEAKKML